ncbi:SpdD-like protein [Streptomyces sp. P9-2B-2]|uniref:SpdD-like protein n=1 Tax=Streptomyces sp. P9-2B-2 TaxID=3057114 RepID=UPI0025B37737|nr:SpdD-like protein [Streptomyces sp. P9-2B-2]WJY40037.1 SpdD-like protein [Streptomyces sp. P9-2B-2]
MFRPKVPTNPTPTGLVIPPAVEPTALVRPTPPPAPVAQSSTRPAVQLTPGTALALVGGGTAVVLIVGAVLVSMLLAVAVSGVSVAVCAVVLRSLLTSGRTHR